MIYTHFSRSVFYGLFLLSLAYFLFTTLSFRETFSDYTPKPLQEPFQEVSPAEWARRAEQVKQAFKHAYHGYEKIASPSDELLPLTDGKINNFNGWGVSAFDSLDTMLIMDLQPEFEHALGVVSRANFSVASGRVVPYFETVIRYLGGLLSAYALSHEKILLDRADQLATQLDGVFDSPSGLPYWGINPTTKERWGPDIGILAELGTLQLEYTYLAKLTRKKEHFDRANNVIHKLYSANLKNTAGMFPIGWNLTSGTPASDSISHISVGAQADSAHEYLLKQYLLTGKSDRANLEMYIRTTTSIISNLLFLSPTRHLLYVTDIWGSTFHGRAETGHTAEHLSCFLPGLLALGAHLLPLDNLTTLKIDLKELGGQENVYGEAARGFHRVANWDLKKLHMWAAEGLAEGCYMTYADQPSGLGPDEIVFGRWLGRTESGGRGYEGDYTWLTAMERWRQSGHRGLPPGLGDKRPVQLSDVKGRDGLASARDYAIRKGGYYLRPETVESFFILWRTSGDARWRHKGWRIFEAIEREARNAVGYASLQTVDHSPAIQDNSMPSYFLAETLKYLYLLFTDEELIPLDKWVFNTEAHPLPVFSWTAEERKHFGIQ